MSPIWDAFAVFENGMILIYTIRPSEEEAKAACEQWSYRCKVYPVRISLPPR
jgi:hypothetical protein